MVIVELFRSSIESVEFAWGVDFSREEVLSSWLKRLNAQSSSVSIGSENVLRPPLPSMECAINSLAMIDGLVRAQS